MKKKFIISGMNCAACASRVEMAVCALPGMWKIEVNLLQNTLRAEFDEKLLHPKDIIAAVERAGYGIVPADNAADKSMQENPGRTEEQRLKRRFCISLLFLLPLMYVSMGHMLGLALPAFLHKPAFFAWVQFVLTWPVLYVNREVFSNGLKTLFRGAPNMNSLIALGSGAAILSGAWFLMCMMTMLAPAQEAMPHLYFESGVMILTLITFGKYLEARAKGKTSNAIEKLLTLTPPMALRLENGLEREFPAEDIKTGDVLIVKAGMRVPADGVISKGHGALDEAALTGESLPVDKAAGQVVRAGTINTAGYFELSVTQTGGQTLLAQIIRLVEDASASKAPIGRLADKVSGIFVPVVIALALLTWLIWWLAGYGFEFAIGAAVAVLVISCPCALGLATPTAIMVGTGTGARHGILFKSAETLEAAHLIRTVVLDKTGTVTQGKPEVTDVFLVPGMDEKEFWTVAASAEQPSEHPLSRAVLRAPQAQGIKRQTVENFKTLPGAGISARVSGVQILAGNLPLMQKESIAIPAEFLTHAKFLAEEGKTVLYFAQKGVFLGILALADQLKPSAAEAVTQLKALDLSIVLLTGDNEHTAQAVAKKLKISQVIAGVLPQDKEAEIRRLQSAGQRVMMVGDGINDAPALARADVGVAVGAGTDAALETADIVLIKNDLAGVAAALRLSRAVIRNIKQNLFWAFFYNVCGIPLAAGIFYPWLGWQLSPMFAAAAMSLSSVFVVSNALRLRHFNPEAKQKFLMEEKMSKIIEIEGMMCVHCAGRVEAALKALPGERVKIDLAGKRAEVSGPATDEELKAAVENAGYKVKTIH